MLVALLCVAGVGVLGATTVTRARAIETRHATDAVRDRALAVAGLAHAAMLDDLEAVAQTAPRMAQYLATVNNKVAAVAPFFSTLIGTHHRIGAVAWYDRSGKLLFRVPNEPSIVGRRFGQQDYFSKARSDGKPHVSNLFVQLGRPKVAVIAYSQRIAYRGLIYGVLVGTTPIAEFDKIIAPYVPSGWTISLYNTSGERVSPSSGTTAKTYTSDPLVRAALSGSPTTVKAGGSISASEPVPEFGWAAVVSRPAKAVDKAVHQTVVRFSVLAGLITGLALLGAIAAGLRMRKAA